MQELAFGRQLQPRETTCMHARCSGPRSWHGRVHTLSTWASPHRQRHSVACATQQSPQQHGMSGGHPALPPEQQQPRRLQNAVAIGGPCDADALAVAQLPVPAPGLGEALVRNQFCGVNFIDTYHRSGLYTVPLPFVLGVEGSGTVEQLGPPAATPPSTPTPRLSVGDRVAYFGRHGSYAQYSTVPTSALVALPDHVASDTAAAAWVQGMTAVSLSTRSYAVRAGDVVLVHAAGGGTGQLLTQLCRHLGATVIGTASSERKASVASAAGARHVLRYTQQDVVDEVMALTGGRGVDVVFDGVGADTFDGSLRCLCLGGTLVSFGNASGKVPPVDILRLSQNNVKLMRPTLFEYVKTRAELEALSGELLAHLTSGVMAPSIQQVLPLEAASDAHRTLESRGTVGKLLLDCT